MLDCTFVVTTLSMFSANAFLKLGTKFLRILAPSCGSMRLAQMKSSIVSQRGLQMLSACMLACACE